MDWKPFIVIVDQSGKWKTFISFTAFLWINVKRPLNYTSVIAIVEMCDFWMVIRW